MSGRKRLQVEAIKDSTKLELKQSPTEHLARLSHRALFLANSAGGKTTLIANLLTKKEFYAGAFSAIYVWSPSVNHDGTWRKVKDYVRDVMHHDPKDHFFDEWDPPKVQEVIDGAFAVTKYQKDHGHKKGHNILVVVDDFADRPDIMHNNQGSGVLNSLFIRGRHANITVWLASQRPSLLSSTIRTQANLLYIWKQRSLKDENLLLDEWSALVPGGKKALKRLYDHATKQKYHFLMVDLMQPPERMFFHNLDTMLQLRSTMDDQDTE